MNDAQRRRLAAIADDLIPETATMPAPSAVGVGTGQLDLVLGARPEIEGPLARALAADDLPALTIVEQLRTSDPEAHDALVLAIVGGYYLHPTVQQRLGYPGQTGQEVQPDTYPDYVHDGLLERVLARGPIYRPTPG